MQVARTSHWKHIRRSLFKSLSAGKLRNYCHHPLVTAYCKLEGCSLFSTDPPQKTQHSYLHGCYISMLDHAKPQMLHCTFSNNFMFTITSQLDPLSMQTILSQSTSESSKVTTASWHSHSLNNSTDPCYKLCMRPYVLTTFGKGDNYVCICG